MRLPVLISVCLSLATTWVIAKNTEFSQSRDLPPLRLAAADLDTILLRTQSLIAEANGPSGEQDSGRETVKLGIRGHEIEIQHFSLASSVAFPREVFRFSYTYSRPDKPISTVTLDFSDYSRRVSVTGDAADQVEALSKLVEKDLLHYSTAIGGATFRHVAGVSLSLTFLTSLIVSAYLWNTRTYSALGMLVCSGLGLLLLLLVPWHRYLAGFAMYQSYSPFLLIRYAPYIAFLSLIATLVGIPLAYFLPQLRKRHHFR
jgi:hypothetical protein